MSSIIDTEAFDNNINSEVISAATELAKAWNGRKVDSDTVSSLINTILTKKVADYLQHLIDNGVFDSSRARSIKSLVSANKTIENTIGRGNLHTCLYKESNETEDEYESKRLSCGGIFQQAIRGSHFLALEQPSYKFASVNGKKLLTVSEIKPLLNKFEQDLNVMGDYANQMSNNGLFPLTDEHLNELRSYIFDVVSANLNEAHDTYKAYVAYHTQGIENAESVMQSIQGLVTAFETKEKVFDFLNSELDEEKRDEYKDLVDLYFEKGPEGALAELKEVYTSLSAERVLSDFEKAFEKARSELISPKAAELIFSQSRKNAQLKAAENKEQQSQGFHGQVESTAEAEQAAKKTKEILKHLQELKQDVEQSPEKYPDVDLLTLETDISTAYQLLLMVSGEKVKTKSTVEEAPTEKDEDKPKPKMSDVYNIFSEAIKSNPTIDAYVRKKQEKAKPSATPTPSPTATPTSGKGSDSKPDTSGKPTKGEEATATPKPSAAPTPSIAPISLEPTRKEMEDFIMNTVFHSLEYWKSEFSKHGKMRFRRSMVSMIEKGTQKTKPLAETLRLSEFDLLQAKNLLKTVFEAFKHLKK